MSDRKGKELELNDSEKEKNRTSEPEALSDDELDSVLGGYQVVFQDSGVNRDSWFVSYMTRRMVQDSIRQEMGSSQGVLPGEITIRGRSFLLNQEGDNIYVQEKP